TLFWMASRARTATGFIPVPWRGFAYASPVAPPIFGVVWKTHLGPFTASLLLHEYVIPSRVGGRRTSSLSLPAQQRHARPRTDRYPAGRSCRRRIRFGPTSLRPFRTVRVVGLWRCARRRHLCPLGTRLPLPP